MIEIWFLQPWGGRAIRWIAETALAGNFGHCHRGENDLATNGNDKQELTAGNFKKFFSHSNRPCAVATRYFSVTGGDARRAALRHASICLLAEGT